MATTAREDLLAAGLAVFDRDGFEGATVPPFEPGRGRQRFSILRVEGAGQHLFWKFCSAIRRRLAAIAVGARRRCAADPAHLDWVVFGRREALSVRVSRSGMEESAVRSGRRIRLATASSDARADRAPGTADDAVLFLARSSDRQIFCRAFFGSRPCRSREQIEF